MRNRKRVVVREDKEQLIDEALERIDEEVEDRRLKGLNHDDLKCLWWKELCIIILPICFWITLLLGVLIFWPATQVLTEDQQDESVYNFVNARLNGKQLIFNETLTILTTKD